MDDEHVELTGDMRGARFHRADLSGATFRTSNLSGVRMRGVDLRNADIDGEIDGVRIHGLDVAALVEAELDRRHPERVALHATTPAALRAGWAGLEQMWAATLAQVPTWPPGTVEASVGGEWSLTQTLRHLLLATDAWLGTAIRGEQRPFHPLGVLFSEAAGMEQHFGLDPAATPTFDEVLEARAGRVEMVRAYLATVTPDELAETRSDPWGDDWAPTVLQCVQVIFNEEWHHHRYATRDLAVILGE